MLDLTTTAAAKTGLQININKAKHFSLYTSDIDKKFT